MDNYFYINLQFFFPPLMIYYINDKSFESIDCLILYKMNCAKAIIQDDHSFIQHTIVDVPPIVCTSCAQIHYGHMISKLQIFKNLKTSNVSFFTVDLCRQFVTHFWPQNEVGRVIYHNLYGCAWVAPIPRKQSSIIE